MILHVCNYDDKYGKLNCSLFVLQTSTARVCITYDVTDIVFSTYIVYVAIISGNCTTIATYEPSKIHVTNFQFDAHVSMYMLSFTCQSFICLLYNCMVVRVVRGRVL